MLLLPVLSKVLESVVASRITRHLEKTPLDLYETVQIQEGKIISRLYLLLASDLSAALDQGKSTAVVALDIEGAFDHMRHEDLIQECNAVGTDGAFLSLLGDYLRDRFLKVTISWRESEEHSITAGLHRSPRCHYIADEDMKVTPTVGRVRGAITYLMKMQESLVPLQS